MNFAQVQQLQKQGKAQSDEENEALTVQKVQQNPKYKGKSVTHNKIAQKKNDSCFYCKAKGHYISKCAKWIADGRPLKSQQQKNATSCSGSTQCNETLTVEMMTVDSNVFAVEGDTDSWYIDNGATTHVTNHRDIFVTFECFQTPVEVSLLLRIGFK